MMENTVNPAVKMFELQKARISAIRILIMYSRMTCPLVSLSGENYITGLIGSNLQK